MGVRIGRLVAACLHQAIADVLPERLEFYEIWLRSKAWRDGAMTLAPMSAVLGFLRTETEYRRVMTTAGRLAAEWTVSAMPPVQRRLIGLLPRPWRARAGLRVAAGIVREVCSASQAATRVRRTDARLSVTASLFCRVREARTFPLCDFYSAATAATLAALGMPARARIEACHAINGDTCIIALDLSGAGSAADRALAA